MQETTKKANRLASETSPYLLQHAYNPVDWYPWGKEALEKARREDKPILLSIGYSACHWCHVMERESFEDPQIAELMNRDFVPVKVDREERPDIDAIYMNFVQMSTGSGGWPLTVFLTPDQVPFYGGTYFPPGDHYGSPGFRRVLTTLSEIYRTRRAELESNRDEILDRLSEAGRFRTEPGEVGLHTLDNAYGQLPSRFDSRYGGFGDAPKFPSTMLLGFLLRYHKRTGSEGALQMAEQSLQAMARGGIYDQLRGGFHRYSVDAQWLVPHFEKMLYDNALLARVYLEAFQVTGDLFYREVVEQTLDWAIAEMLDPAGGFYSALDADSEGEEGRFYVWSSQEIEEVLGTEAARIFGSFHGVSTAGNFEGQNILFRPTDLESLAEQLNRPKEELRTSLMSSRAKLLAHRSRRVRPGLDDKVLTAWNGLILTAFAEAGFVLDRSDYLGIAVQTADFLITELFKDGRLRRSWTKGKASLNAYLEDYSMVVEGLLAVFQASGDHRFLKQAEELQELQVELFWDEADSDFFFTPADHEELIVRQKEHLDNATPSGNSVSCLNLLRVSELTGNTEYRTRAERMLKRIGGALSQLPTAFGYWLQALDYFLGPVVQICVVGAAEERRRLLEPVRKRFLPNKVVAQGAVEGQDGHDLLSLLADKKILQGKATVYLCHDFSCRRPVTSAAELEQQLAT